MNEFTENSEHTNNLIMQYENMLYKLALNYCKNIADAEDVVQDVFLKFLEKQPVFLDKQHEKAWFIRVTINTSKNVISTYWRRNVDELKDEFIFSQEEQNKLFYEIMKLPPKYSTVIHLHYYEGYSTKEIGNMLKKSTSAITTRLNRARTMLRKSLEKDSSNCLENDTLKNMI